MYKCTIHAHMHARTELINLAHYYRCSYIQGKVNSENKNCCN